MIILAYILSGLSLLMSVLLLIGQPKFPLSFWVLLPKLPVGALSPHWAIMGPVGAIIGGISGAYWAIPMGIVGAGVMIWYVWQCTRNHNGFEDAFCPGWEDQIPQAHGSKALEVVLEDESTSGTYLGARYPFMDDFDVDRQQHCDFWPPG